jgi:molybdenum cofactor cytidylyltransferase
LKSVIIILAAGASTRLGKPKQLLPYKGTTLLLHAIDEAKLSRAEQILVVLGANYDRIQKEIPFGKKIKIIVNEDWAEGIASSIRSGIGLLRQTIKPDCAILAVCDQPYIHSDLFNSLMDSYVETKKQIVACQYERTLGTPVLFDKSFFDQLMQLKGDQGAKNIITRHPDQTTTIPFQSGQIDIDTNEQYKELLA